MAQIKKYENRAEQMRAYRARKNELVQNLLTKREIPDPPINRNARALARWRMLHTQALAAVSQLHQEMSAYAEARSEKWQESENGEAFEDKVSSLEEAYWQLKELEL